MLPLALIIIAIITLLVMLFGILWFSPKIFGGIWLRNINLTPEKIQNKNRYALLIIFFATIILVTVTENVLSRFGVQSVYEASGIATMMWFGFVVPIKLTTTLWEVRSMKLFLVEVGYWFFVMQIVGILLFLL